MAAKVCSSHPVSFSESICGEMKFFSYSYWASDKPALIFNIIRVTSNAQESFWEILRMSYLCFSIFMAISIIWSKVWFSKKSRLFNGEGFLSLNLLRRRFYIILNWIVRLSSTFLSSALSFLIAKCSSMISNNSVVGIAYSKTMILLMGWPLKFSYNL